MVHKVLPKVSDSVSGNNGSMDDQQYSNAQGAGYTTRDPRESIQDAAKYLRDTKVSDGPEMVSEKTVLVQQEDVPDLSLEDPQDVWSQHQLELVQEGIRFDQREHDVLLEKIDAVIKQERQRAKDLYAIENHKKNTLDYALKVYGDDADVEAIFDSAGAVKQKVEDRTQQSVRELSDEIQEREKEPDVVSILMPNGSVHHVDKDVAYALSVYSEQTHDGSFQDGYKKDGFRSFTDEEKQKLQELQDLMNSNDQRAAQFEEKAPETMSQEEYNAYNRERRFKEFGYPTGLSSYDYVMTQEGVYEWNGRRLPDAMASLSLQQQKEKDGLSGPAY